MATQIRISDHFNYSRLLRFTVPSIVMMVFTSLYSIVDGVFVSNFVGKTAFAAVNLIFPFLMVLGVVGFMLGTGGSALVAKQMGEQKPEKARQTFTLIVLAGAFSGVVLAAIGIPLLKSVAMMLGAGEELASLCAEYGRLVLSALPFFILQNMFQSLFVAAERPRMGLWVTVAAGLTNILLDYLLIAVFSLGLRGAAIATAASEATGGIIPIVFFAMRNKSPLRFVRTHMDWRAIGQSCSNGLSEFFGNISSSIVAMCYNYQLLRFFGEDGVSAYGVIMYVQFVFFAVFLGYTVGTSPIVSYNYGAKNHRELHSILVKSIRLIGMAGIVLTACIELSAGPLSTLFVGYDTELLSLTRRAFRIYGISYLLVGYNFYASAFFTALNNGLISATIATTRTLLFETSAVFLIPALLGHENIWFSVTFAEAMSLALSATLIVANRKRYNY